MLSQMIISMNILFKIKGPIFLTYFMSFRDPENVHCIEYNIVKVTHQNVWGVYGISSGLGCW